MKRACVVLLALAVLAGCAPAAPAPTPEPTPETTPEAEFYFTRENFPVLDGSTSMVPLAEAAAAVSPAREKRASGERAVRLSQSGPSTPRAESERRVSSGSCQESSPAPVSP